MKGKEFFTCPCGCGLEVEDEVVKIAEHLDRVLKKERLGELVILSGARCRERNTKIGGSRNSAHMLGKALDISAKTSQIRYVIFKCLFNFSVLRVGWHQQRNFIHFDVADAKTRLPDGSGTYPARVIFGY
jgi:uncharacterized protein YcbK (DUF882 family)